MQINAELTSSPYISSYILYSLSSSRDLILNEVKTKLINFLKEEMLDNASWSFWGSRCPYKLPPDLDDTACVSYILKKVGAVSKGELNNEELFLNNRDEDGLYYTWLGNRDIDPVKIDAVVNANILLYLGMREDTESIRGYLRFVLFFGQEKTRSVYGLNNLSLYYVISRLYYENVYRDEDIRGIVIEKLTNALSGSGALNDLDMALALCILINFHSENIKGVDDYLGEIVNRQQADGSWEMNAFFRDFKPSYYGSQELTTAFMIEAMAKYLQLQDSLS